MAIDKAPSSEPDGTGVIAIGFNPNRERPEQRSLSVIKIAWKNTDPSPLSHIALHLEGVSSYRPHWPRLEPATGRVEFKVLKECDPGMRKINTTVTLNKLAKSGH